MKVSKSLDVKIIITSPNDDKGSEIIKKNYKRIFIFNFKFFFYESLGGYRYQAIMSLANTCLLFYAATLFSN